MSRRKKRNPKKGVPMPRWTRLQMDLLVLAYPESTNKAVARITGRSVTAVVTMAHRLSLRKTAERLRQMGAENVAIRWR